MWSPLHKLKITMPQHKSNKRKSNPYPQETLDEIAADSGFFLSKPQTTYLNGEQVLVNGLEIGHSSMQGFRPSMEDTHIIQPITTTSYITNHTFLSIFDGHAGDSTAKYLEANMVRVFESNQHWLEYCKLYKKTLNANQHHIYSNSSDHKTNTKHTPTTEHQYQYQQEKEQMREELMVKHVCEAFIETFLELDDQLRELKYESGSTGVCTLITPAYIYVASVGDSRAVLGTVKGRVISLSDDHKPSLSAERRRIEAAGGFVFMDRVCGELAMSRAFGDFQYKDSAFAMSADNSQTHTITDTSDEPHSGSQHQYHPPPQQPHGSTHTSTSSSTGSSAGHPVSSSSSDHSTELHSPHSSSTTTATAAEASALSAAAVSTAATAWNKKQMLRKQQAHAKQMVVCIPDIAVQKRWSAGASSSRNKPNAQPHSPALTHADDSTSTSSDNHNHSNNNNSNSDNSNSNSHTVSHEDQLNLHRHHQQQQQQQQPHQQQQQDQQQQQQQDPLGSSEHTLVNEEYDADDDPEKILLLACDGVFDVMSNVETISYLQALLDESGDGDGEGSMQSQRSSGSSGSSVHSQQHGDGLSGSGSGSHGSSTGAAETNEGAQRSHSHTDLSHSNHMAHAVVVAEHLLQSPPPSHSDSHSTSVTGSSGRGGTLNMTVHGCSSSSYTSSVTHSHSPTHTQQSSLSLLTAADCEDDESGYYTAQCSPETGELPYNNSDGSSSGSSKNNNNSNKNSNSLSDSNSNNHHIHTSITHLHTYADKFLSSQCMAESLVDVSLELGSTDNISVIVVKFLEHFKNPYPSASTITTSGSGTGSTGTSAGSSSGGESSGSSHGNGHSNDNSNNHANKRMRSE